MLSLITTNPIFSGKRWENGKGEAEQWSRTHTCRVCEHMLPHTGETRTNDKKAAHLVLDSYPVSI